MRASQEALLLAVVVGASLGVATAAVLLVEQWSGVPNASALYLTAVVMCGRSLGTVGAIAAAVGAFLVYTCLFAAPLHTWTVKDPGVLLSVVLFLFVGIVVGELVALQRSCATTAEAREREARALFAVSRVLATRIATRSRASA